MTGLCRAVQGRQLVLIALSEGTKGRQEDISLFQNKRPDKSPEATGNRADQALQRLKAKGLVKAGGGVWVMTRCAP